MSNGNMADGQMSHLSKTQEKYTAVYKSRSLFVTERMISDPLTGNAHANKHKAILLT